MNRYVLFLLFFLLNSCTIETDWELPYITEQVASLAHKSQEPILLEYLDEFVEDAAEYGVDLNYVYNEPIVIRVTDDIANGIGTHARSYGVGKKGIFVFFLSDIWYKRDYFKRKIILYHEFGHDILNIKCHCGSELMFQSLDRDINDTIKFNREFKKMLIQSGHLD